MKRLCACVATSEKTWPRNSLMALDSPFFAARSQFDLAIIFNGEVSAEAKSYFSRIATDHFIPRENVGNEGGAFSEAIRRLPPYDWYLFLHDDHWFWDPNWCQFVLPTLENKDRTCFGNLVIMKFHWDEQCNELLKPWNFSLHPADYVFPMLQGMAGFLPRTAIDVFLKRGGLPHFDYQQAAYRGLTHFTELAFSLLLIHEGLSLEGLPGGFEFLLLHGSNVLCDHNRDSFQRLPNEVQAHARELHTRLHG